MKFTILCLAILSISVSSHIIDEEDLINTIPTNEYNIHDYLLGDWNIYKSSNTLNGHQLYSSIFTSYNIVAENNTNHLIGNVYNNDTVTGEISDSVIEMNILCIYICI
jgi:hypothetical protein